MGNCIKKQSETQWAGEDWGSPSPLPAPEKCFSGDPFHGKLFQEKGVPPFSSSAMSSATEVKIKITKKQLEELLGTMDIQGISVQQVLAKMINGCDRIEAHQRPWRPTLQSIRELE